MNNNSTNPFQRNMNLNMNMNQLPIQHHQLQQLQEQQQQQQQQLAQHYVHQNFNSTIPTPSIPILKSSSDQVQQQQQQPLPFSIPIPIPQQLQLDLTPMRRTRSGSDQSMIDNGKICQFCEKQFSHRGSLSRHLDNKKGDSLHPVKEIDFIRNASKRRKSVDVISSKYNESTSSGGNSRRNSEDLLRLNSTLASMKKRRSSKKSMARSQMLSYSTSGGQREKSKLRRKLRDRRIKAKIYTNEWFIEQFSKKTLLEPIFPDDSPALFLHHITLHLPIHLWPNISSNGLPDESSLEFLIDKFSKNAIKSQLITTSFQNYQKLNEMNKKILWFEQLTKILDSTIGHLSLFDLYDVKNIISRKEQTKFEEICRNDNLSEYVDIVNEDNEEVEGDDDTEEDHQLQNLQPQMSQNSHLNPHSQQQQQQQLPQHHQQQSQHHQQFLPELQQSNFDDFNSTFDKFY